MNKTLVVILGPTAVGKSDISIQVARHFNIPIINADSRQIFSEIPIGTAAPTPEQQKIVKHYFVGNHSITDYYSASMFEKDVLQLLPILFETSNIALLSGGSMMYIDAVCNGIDDIPTVDDETRRLLKHKYDEQGLYPLLKELEKVDADYYRIVDKKNTRRIIHALEIYYVSGKPYTSFRTNCIHKRPFNILKIGIDRPREELYDRINSRVETMVKSGLVDEARQLLPYRELNSLNTVGYKELFDYFDGKIPLEEAVRRIQSNTRRYMRKQLTWFKKDASIHWFGPDNIKEIINIIATYR